VTPRTSVLFVLGCGVFWSVTPTAQNAASALPVLRDVQAAEAEALTFPRGVASEEQPSFAAAPNLTGTADRRCVEVGDGWNVRSGDFVAGPMSEFQTHWQQGYTKVWWSPRYLTDTRPRDLGDDGLVVRETRLEPAGLNSEYRHGGLVRNTTAFFNSGVWLPTPGKWMMVATYKSNWGCFIVNTQGRAR
jgi:hypothetical protein